MEERKERVTKAIVFDNGYKKFFEIESDVIRLPVDLRISQLVLLVSATPGCLAFNVDGKFNIIPKRNIENNETSFPVYSQKIAVKFHPELQIYYTDYPMNHIRILMPDKNTGKFEIETIGVASQDYGVFAVRQREQGQCFRKKDGSIWTPFFSPEEPRDWPQLYAALENIFQNNDLPSFESFQLEDIKIPKLNKCEGIVLWWNRLKGIGCIQTAEDPVRAYWRAIQNYCGNSYFKELKEGGKVYIDDVRKSYFKELKEGGKVYIDDVRKSWDSRSSIEKEAYKVFL